MRLEQFESRHDQVTQVLTLTLAVVDLISLIQVLCLEEVHDWENLTVVGHEGLTDGVSAEDELLKDVEGSGNDGGVTGVQSRYLNNVS